MKHLLGNVKDQIPLQFPGIYEIPCECGKVYVGQTGRTVATRLKEHQRYISFNYPDKSVVAEHAIQELHGIDLKNTRLLVKESHWLKRIIREAIEIKKSKDNLNLNTGFELYREFF